SDREDTPGPADVLDLTTDPPPSLGPLASQHAAKEREIEAAARPTPAPPSPGAATPTSERRITAFPAPARGTEKPAPEPQRTTDFTPQQAAGRRAVPASPDAATSAPAACGRYQVQRALGAGGFGAVYLGRDSQLDRAVAIKVLHAGLGQPQTEGERALQEARRLARLRHPGIVTVHDVGVHEGRVYIVSDYLDGPELGRWLQDNRPAWPEAGRIAAAVADALAHAHAQLVIH